MSTTRQFLVVALSMAITTLLTLGLLRLPFAYPLQAAVNESAQHFLAESLDTRLAREMDQMMYPRHRPMLYHLAMFRLAEQARRARLQAISRAAERNWGGHQTIQQRKGSGLGHVVYRAPIARSAPDAHHSLLLVLMCVAFAITWLLVRRR